MSPCTSVTRAPYRSHSTRKRSGVSAGMNTSHAIPARAAYAAAAPPALPAVGTAIALCPSSFALETAAARPRALNDPVGFPDSSLIQRLAKPALLPSFSAARVGVPPSPRETMWSASPTATVPGHVPAVRSPADRAARPIVQSAERLKGGPPQPGEGQT